MRTGLVTGLTVLAFAVGARGQAAGRVGAVPVTFTHVRLADPFWAPRLAVNRTRTLPAVIAWCEKTGRIENFRRAAAGEKGGFQGIWFNDSDVYKVLEGACYALAEADDPKLRKVVDAWVALLAKAQQKDGYLYTYHTLGNPALRWKQIAHPARHELYCAGHLIEAGVGHFESTGKRTLLEVAVRLADHIASVFGPGKRPDVPEHEGIELALIRLYRATGQKRHLALARHFLESRGVARGRTLYGAYSQDHLPARRQAEAVGHAVRATYFYAGLADLAAETGDAELLAACRRLWESITARKMYVTGGVGARRRGEAFGADYELPNDTAYAETCAAIGLAFFAHRMLQLDPDGRYGDVLERVLYNAVAAGVSLDGRAFFYSCPLASRGPAGFFRSGGAAGDLSRHRSGWFGCACCPSNVVRFLPRIGGLVYTRDAEGVYVNLYAAGVARLTLPAGPVVLRQGTEYPWAGRVCLTVTPSRPTEFELRLRLPGWCATPALKLNGKAIEKLTVARGYARLRRRWQAGDRVELDLPMPAERVKADPRVKADVGRVALRRGPIVYCLEGVDHDGRVRHVSLPPAAALTAEHRKDLLGGVTVLTGQAVGRFRAEGGDQTRPVALQAVPFAVWDNRRAGPMIVWIPESPALSEPAPRATLASRARASASHCWPGDSVSALNDQIEPVNSHNLAIPRHTWWDHRGSAEWVRYDFPRTEKVAAVAVYWFDDRATGHCRVPASWRLLWKDGDRWRPVQPQGPYGTNRDAYNRVAFAPVATKALRIEAQLQKDCSGGVLEWRVER